MKRKLLGILSSYCLLLLLQGCTDVTALPDTGEAVVPVQLCARGGALQGSTATRIEPKEAFSASIAFSTASGNYTSLSDDECEGIWNASVSTSEEVTWASKGDGGVTLASPFYPRYGAYLYLVAYAPQAVPTNGAVTYTLSGQEDLLYVEELKGNRWDGGAFSALTFNHLLTRLCFKAKKQADGLAVKITRITVNEAPTQAVVSLATGVAEFSATAPGLSLAPDGGGTEISNATPVSVGNLMLPPLSDTGKYTLTVETSVGTYSNIEISYGGTPGADILKAGMSHDVTLSIADKSLSISSIEVKKWLLIIAGDVEIGDRD